MDRRNGLCGKTNSIAKYTTATGIYNENDEENLKGTNGWISWLIGDAVDLQFGKENL